MIFYKPMLAKSISKPFSGMDWIFETKWDGFRAIAYVEDDLFPVQSRNGNEFKRIKSAVLLYSGMLTSLNFWGFLHLAIIYWSSQVYSV